MGSERGAVREKGGVLLIPFPLEVAGSFPSFVTRL